MDDIASGQIQAQHNSQQHKPCAVKHVIQSEGKDGSAGLFRILRQIVGRFLPLRDNAACQTGSQQNPQQRQGKFHRENNPGNLFHMIPAPIIPQPDRDALNLPIRSRADNAQEKGSRQKIRRLPDILL